MPTCRSNITMPYLGDDVTVSLDVDFEVEPADPSVGIMGDGVAAFTAKVIGVDVEDTTPELLAAVQVLFDFSEEKYRDVIEEDCIESLSHYYGDDRGGM